MDNELLKSLGIKELQTIERNLNMILWGEAGVGKTTLAATSRGNKLWLLFDKGGSDSIAGLKQNCNNPKSALNNEIYVIDASKMNPKEYIPRFKTYDPFSIERVVSNEQLNIRTIVVDSLTILSDDILAYYAQYGGYKGASVLKPTMEVYGARLATVKTFINDVMTIAAKHNKDVIFIAHEHDKVNDEGSILETTLSLGGNLSNSIVPRLGEVWNVSIDRNGKRKISLYPVGRKKLIKSRMFDLNKIKEIDWDYNFTNPNISLEISNMLDVWTEKGYTKLTEVK